MNRGQIVRSTDVDVYSFQVGAGGRANLTIERADTPRSMLDTDASIFDATGKSVAQSNLQANRSTQFDVPLAAGNHTLAIKGGAEGTASVGFTNYSSVGFNAIRVYCASKVPHQPRIPLEIEALFHPGRTPPYPRKAPMPAWRVAANDRQGREMLCRLCLQ